MGRPGRAAEVFARALEVPPNNPFEYSGLADLWVAADEFDQAAGAVDRGLVAFPGDVILLQARAEVLLRRGQAAEALVQLDELASANPDDVAIAVLRMEALAVLDRRAELRAAGKAFEQAYPLLGHGTIFVGLVAAREGDQVTADAAWDRVDALNAECVECTTDQAQMLAWARAQAPAAKVEPLDR